jgi:Fur family ferric uptake transcriptional regulator
MGATTFCTRKRNDQASTPRQQKSRPTSVRLATRVASFYLPCWGWVDTLHTMPLETVHNDADIDAMMAQFQHFLDKKQLKSTRQRDIIARTFFATGDHVTIEDLLAKSRALNAKIGYATVYRTLKLLSECGLAAPRRFGDGQTVYETAGDSAHHDHLVCLECNHVLEFENEEIERLQDQVARSFGFTLVRHKLELYGLCARAAGLRGGSCPRDDHEASLERKTK